MPLITSPRHTSDDLERWRLDERVDAVNAQRWRARLATRAALAAEHIRAFASAPCYAGCSWGKDSLVVAHIIATADMAIPVVWIRVDGAENPDCPFVRDAFLAQWPLDYHEIRAPAGVRRTSATGFAEAARRFGDRHVSGVRGAEAKYRAMRMARFGVSTERTCAPIGHWSTAEVFAYCHLHGLPVHPAYAMTMGGAYPRERLRVGALGGERGTGFGRREWEEHYYRGRLDPTR